MDLENYIFDSDDSCEFSEDSNSDTSSDDSDEFYLCPETNEIVSKKNTFKAQDIETIEYDYHKKDEEEFNALSKFEELQLDYNDLEDEEDKDITTWLKNYLRSENFKDLFNNESNIDNLE